MNNKWNEFSNMDEIVQKAINSGNYSSLENDINKIVRNATNKFEDIMDKGINKVKDLSFNFNSNNFNIDESFQGLEPQENSYTYKLYISDSKLLSRGLAGTIAGGSMVFSLLIGLMGLIFTPSIEGKLVGIIAIVMSLIPSIWWFFDGIKTLKDRLIFKHYQKVLELSDNKSFAKIEDLMRETGESRKKTLKRLKKMINKMWFKEGHLDKNETTFISTNETYALYQKTQIEFENRQNIEKEINTTETSPLNSEAIETLEQGKKYLTQISHLNDIIPGYEVSNKIFKIETLTAKILKRVEEYPENIDDIRQLMKYYLPMTIKLLTAYAEIDKEDTKIENVEKSKKEIENALDSLNTAFGKLLEELYKDKAWDIESDVSVLNAMLKREGLKESDFKTTSTSKDEDIKLNL